eukprot:363837-Chlamydomonas_euryale.AAC.2
MAVQDLHACGWSQAWPYRTCMHVGGVEHGHAGLACSWVESNMAVQDLHACGWSRAWPCRTCMHVGGVGHGRAGLACMDWVHACTQSMHGWGLQGGALAIRFIPRTMISTPVHPATFSLAFPTTAASIALRDLTFRWPQRSHTRPTDARPSRPTVTNYKDATWSGCGFKKARARLLACHPTQPQQLPSACLRDLTHVPRTPAQMTQPQQLSSACLRDFAHACLEACGWDTDAAYDALRKKGLAAAAKKASRLAAEGLVGVAATAAGAGPALAVVEVNSETDFVSRSDVFRALVRHVAAAALPLRAAAGPGHEVDAAQVRSDGHARLSPARGERLARRMSLQS